MINNIFNSKMVLNLFFRNMSVMEETVNPTDSFKQNNELCLDESAFANEMLSWYQDEATPQSRTATLV